MKIKYALFISLAMLLASCSSNPETSITSTSSSATPSVSESTSPTSQSTSVSASASTSVSTSVEATGFNVTFSVDEHATLTVYKTNTYETVDTDTSYQTRNGETGEYCNDGDKSQVNFKLVAADGYYVSSVTATEGTYNNIKVPSDTGVENGYRVTKINANTTITVVTSPVPATGFNVNFVKDENVTLTVYTTKTYEVIDTDAEYKTRNGDTGEYCSDGEESQVNFKLTVAAGHYIESITATSGTYKNVKWPDDTTVSDAYRVTKITADTTITITTTTTAPVGYNVNFATVEHASIIVYTTKDFTTIDADVSYQSRNGDTGQYCNNNEDSQVNFKIVPEDGYAVDTVSATKGTYKNIKGPTDTEVTDGYRLTKVKGDTTITVVMKSL